MEDHSLEMKGIYKEFPGVKALMGVDFALKPGEVHALLGMNGAGKSTLIKILAGIYPMDSGEIYLNGTKVDIPTPLAAKSLGISTVYQDPQMVPSYSGYENIYLGSESSKKSVFSVFSRSNLAKRAEKLLEKYPFQIDLSKPVAELETVEKETIAVLRALSQENTSILVLDEPTSILTRKEDEVLFKQIDILKKSGISIIYITHRLGEVFQVADRFTVLRDGMSVGTHTVGDEGVNHNKITELMLGKTMTHIYPERTGNPTNELMRLEDLSLEGYYQNINMSIRKGEITGVFGLVGSGFDELCKTLFGLMQPTAGKIFIKDRQVAMRSVNDAIGSGIFLIPGDRRVQGQISDESISFNISLSALDKISTIFGLVRSGKEKRATQQVVDNLQIKTPSVSQKVGLLSGGNQQKVVIGKGLYTDSDIYIFEEPTTGVDVGAKKSIYELIRNLAKEKAVIVVSSDCEEVYGLCDRAMVLFKGRVVLDKPIEQTRLDEMLLCGLTGGKNGK
jgi:ribose transport system ATP-binding protein